MEISYDIIIKYLAKNDKKIFSNKKHILQHSDKFPDFFSNLLQNKFYKYGVTIFNKNNINISLYMSILTLINKEFITFTMDEEIMYMNMFKEKIKEKYNTFTNDVTQHIQLFCNMLDCTILIFDFKNTNIKIAYSDVICNPWKPIFLLANYEDMWEPIMSDSKRSFSYNHPIIKKILLDGNIIYNNNNEYILKEYILNENIKEYINEIQEYNNENQEYNNEIQEYNNEIQEYNNENQEYNNKKQEYNNKKQEYNNELKTNDIELETNDIELKINNNELETFINKKELDTNNEVATINKKTKNELFEICKIKKIKVTTKMLKKELIDLILNN